MSCLFRLHPQHVYRPLHDSHQQIAAVLHFPQHFGTYQVRDDNSFWTRGYPQELKMYLSQDLQKRYHQLNIGDMFEIQ